MAFDLVAAFSTSPDSPFFRRGSPAVPLTESPQQITLKFSPGVTIDASTLAGNVSVVNAQGGVPLDVGLTVDDAPNQNQVVIRFKETLGDGTYQINVGAGLKSSNPADSAVVTTVSVQVNLGAFVVGVVPQPVSRVGGVLTQARNTIDVYFNRNDPLNQVSAETVTSYRLFEVDSDTGADVDPLAPLNPTSVTYSATTGKATLTFAAGAIADGKLYRLQVGAAEALVPRAATVFEGSDINSSFSTAKNLGVLTGAGAIIEGRISETNRVVSTPAGDLWFPTQPGTVDEPGHRDTPADSGMHGLPAWMTRPETGPAVGYYNFKTIYGKDGQGNDLFNAITENQKQRAREVFELISRSSGISFVESEAIGLTVVTGDVRAVRPGALPTALAGIASDELAVMNSTIDWGASEYGGRWFTVAMHEIGHAIGLPHSYDVPSIMGSGLPGENVFPGDYDAVHLRQLYPTEGADIDVYAFSLATAGTLTAETVIARPGEIAVSPLDSVLTLYREVNGKREIVARNDDSFGRDSFIGLDLSAGTYFIAVTSKGNTNFNPEVSDSGAGGQTAGDYSLKLGFTPVSTSATTIVDSSGTTLDGDRDGKAGGAFSFWFNTAAVNETVFVDKVAAAGGTGSIGSPYNTVKAAIDNVGSAKIIRIVGNDASTPYLIGFDRAGRPLPDGSTFNVPKDVTVMIDEGAVFKLRAAVIDVGSASPLVDRSGAAIQVLGTPDRVVQFTSFHDDSIGGNSDGVGPAATGGDWGGIVLRSNSDSATKKAFVNTIGNAALTFGGGQVRVDSKLDSFAPIQLESTRPTIAFNTIRKSAGAAIAADPNSFEESANRAGPEIRGNRLVENTTNGLFLKIRTAFGSPIDKLDVPARLRSNDIVYVLQENLLIDGGVGGFVEDAATFDVYARRSGRLTIDPGVVVKLQGSRIELGRGTSQLIAEGTPNNRVIFTSLGDNRFGAGGTFDTNGNLPDVRAAGDWGGIVLNAGATASIDYAYIAFGGGQTPIEGAFDRFNVIEVHQGDLRIAHSRIENNADGAAITDRAARGTNVAATIFVRGGQPVILDNDFRDNRGAVVSINANALSDVALPDPGRSTGVIDRNAGYDDNRGALVRGNRLSYSIDAPAGRPAGGAIGGMQVRGEEITVESVWDDTDIVHVLQSEIIVENFHTATGIRLVSRPDASLVVKLAGANAGFTAAGYGLDIDDRIGGTVQIVGQPGYPVILTSLADDSIGASLDPLGRTVKDTGNNGATTPVAGDWRSLKFLPFSNDRNVSIVLEAEKTVIGTTDVNGSAVSAQSLGVLAPNFATAGNSWESAQEKSGDENRRLGFEVHGRIADDNPGDVDVYTFTGYSGSEVWIDIDKTAGALDAMVELLDASGRVLARSADAQADFALQPTTVGIGSPLEKDAWRGGDYYTLNPKDPGMRVELPSLPGQPIGTLTQYYVRVRSQPRYEPETVVGGVTATTQAQYEADLADPTKITGGATSGAYELRVRLRQRDEKPGSTVRYADIRYPTIGIDVQGLPRNSQLTGEAGENPSDTTNAASASPLASAQYVGNLLQADRSTISIAGTIANEADVDWYTFALNYEQIQSISGVNGSTKTWSTVFDIDYGDGFRGDLTLSVFDSTGKLIYVGRDSNVASDQPGVSQGNDFDDLSRGTVGKLDPFIGSVQLPAGTPTGSGSIEGGVAVTPPDPSRQLRYYVAVSSNERLPAALDATFESSATNSLIRLEPINSVQRIVEDHIGSQGYKSGSGAVTTEVAPTTGPMIDVKDRITLAAHVTPFTLSDVTLFVTTASSLVTVDAMRGGAAETKIVTDYGAAQSIGDLVMRSDGRLYSYSGLTNTPNTAGRLDLIDTGTGARTSVGNDSIPQPAGGITDITNIAAQGVGASAVTTYKISPPNVGVTPSTVSGTVQYTAAVTGIPATGTWSFAANALGELTFAPVSAPAGLAAPLSGSVNGPTGVMTIVWSSPVVPANAVLLVVSRQEADPQAVTTDQVDAIVWQRTNVGEYANLFYAVRDGNRSRLYRADPSNGSAAVVTGQPWGRVNAANDAYIQSAGNSIGVVTGMAFIENTLYGVDNLGNLFTINTGTAVATIVTTFAGTAFSGLTIGPQNLAGGPSNQLGYFADKLFAITASGTLYAFDKTGNQLMVFDSNNDGIADATSITTSGLSGVTGLAFSPLDINLWHPTTLRGNDSGHGINASPDDSRGAGPGGKSMYFGFEQAGSGTYAGYAPAGVNGQYGVVSKTWQQDLSSNSDIPNTYNLAGGAYGSLTTNPFSLQGYDYTDKPTLYFNYFLDTQDASGKLDQMRDSARAFVSIDGGVTWNLVATNNATRSGLDKMDAELPSFNSVSSKISTDSNQHVQELYDSKSWRQARIDLGIYAGQADIRLRFDFSTAGEFDPTQKNAAGNLINGINGVASATGDFESAERGQNNKFEGFYIDDIIVGFAERGEMVTGAVSNQTAFYDIATPFNPDKALVLPQQSLQGPYQLEIRRGTEYGSQANANAAGIVIDRTFDTNDDLVASNGQPGNARLGDANLTREQGRFLIENNIISDASSYGISIDSGVRDAGTLAAGLGSPRNLPTLNAGRLVPGVVVANNVITASGVAGILFSGDATTGNVPPAAIPFGRLVNNTIYGGATPQGVGVQVTENAGPTLLNNLFANLKTGVSVDSSSLSNTVIGGSAYFGVAPANEVVGATQSQRVALASNPFVNAAGRNFYLTAGSAAIDSGVNSLGDRPAVVAVTSPLGIPESPILAPERDLYGQLRGDDPGQASAPGLGSNVFKDRGAIDRVDFNQPFASLAMPKDGALWDKDAATDRVRLEKADARGVTSFELQLDDVGVGIDKATVISSAFEVRRNGALLIAGTDYTFSYLESSNRVVFQSSSVFPVGGYTIIVKQAVVGGLVANVVTDLAGNPLLPNQSDGTTAYSIELADVPSAPAGLLGTSSDSQVSLAWTAASSEGTPLVRYEVERATNSTFTGPTVTIVDPSTVNLVDAPLVNGTQYWFRVRAVNAVGESEWSNVLGPIVPLPVPTFALAADTGAAANDWVTKNPLVNVVGVLGGASWEYTVNGGTNWTAGTGSTFTLPSGTTYATGAVRVRQTVSGTRSAEFFNPSAITVDTTAPVAPSIALTNDTGFSGSDGVTVNGSVTVTGIEPGAAWQFSTNGGTNWAAGTGTTFTLPAGTYAAGRVRVRQTDLAGNTSSEGSNAALIKVVLATPTFSLVSDTGASSTDGVTRDGRISVSGIEPNALWQFSTNGGANWTTGSGATFTLPVGVYSAGRVKVRQTDLAGNQSEEAVNAAKIEVDTAAVSPSFALDNDTGPSAFDGVTSAGLVNVFGVEPGATWQLTRNGGVTWSAPRASTVTTFALPVGAYAAGMVRVRQMDVAGNASAEFSNPVAIVVDMTAPAVPSITGSLPSGSRTNLRTPTFSGTADPGSTVAVVAGSSLLGAAVADGAGNWSLVPGPLPDGRYDVVATASDLAGNMSPASSVYQITIDTVSPIAPAPTRLTGRPGDGSVALVWTAPRLPVASMRVLDYVIEFRPLGGAWTRFTDGVSVATSATVTGLTNGTPYEFRVAAITSPGPMTSVFSQQSTALTPIARPAVPEQFTARRTSSGTVSTSWSPPATVAGAGPVTGYVLQYRLTSSSSWTTVNLSATTTARAVTRLRAGASYAFRVAAQNSAGVGGFTNEAVVTA